MLLDVDIDSIFDDLLNLTRASSMYYQHAFARSLAKFRRVLDR